MSVYCSPAEQDKPTDGSLHSNRSRGKPSRSGRGLDEGDEGGRVKERHRVQMERFRKQLATFEPVQHGAIASDRHVVIVSEHALYGKLNIISHVVLHLNYYYTLLLCTILKAHNLHHELRSLISLDKR